MHKPEWLSQGAELLLERWEKRRGKKPYDVIIVGSGYGGAVAAARLAACQDMQGSDLTVCVLERGKEHVPGTFPNSFSELPGHIRFSRFDDPVAKGVREGLFDLRIGKDVTVLVANGLGGGSLINAGVAAEPEAEVFRDPRWPYCIRKEWGGGISKDKSFADALEKLGAEDARVKDRDDQDLDKHKQFVTFADKLDVTFAKKLELSHTKARITVDPATCIQCGDCATGCNIGAKKTLATNYLAEAWQYGAEIYTGATVSHVEKRDKGWAVFLELTTQPRPLQKNTLREIRAKTVILAAGALGSTEILMRSKERCRDFQVSKCLGKRFSTNGDMISALLHEPGTRVNAAPEESLELCERKVGPTITGIARGKECRRPRTGIVGANARRRTRVVIEELAIPGALRRVFEEVLTTTAMLESLGRRDRDEHRPVSESKPGAGDPVEVDPAAVDPQAIERCQVFAAMGDDRALGRLELVPGWADSKQSGRVTDGAIRVHWPKAGKRWIYKLQDILLRSSGLGTYLRNPLWQPLPEGFSAALSGEKPTGLLFSVHPLGGCPMGEDVENGVVDHMGRVFDPATDKDVHAGLLVLDGSIVPTALGTNPLLTITALAERAITLYSVGRWISTKRQKSRAKLPKDVSVEPVLASPAVTGLRFAERMTGELRFGGPGTTMEAELTLEFEPVGNLLEFLQKPNRRLDLGKGTLRVRKPAKDGEVAPWQETEVQGCVQLLVRGETKPIERTFGALSAYWKNRGAADLVSMVRAQSLIAPATCWVRRIALVTWVFCRALSRGACFKEALLAGIESDKMGKGYVALASRVGEIRELSYEFTLKHRLKDAAGKVLPEKIKGRKTLRYGVGTNPWRQLIDLNVTADASGAELGTLTVDPAYFFQGFASQLQITKQRDLPAAWMDLASLGLFLARIILKIHFWSFRLPEYQKYDPMRDVRRLPGPLEPLHMERYVVGYPETPQDAGIFLPVTRYRQDTEHPGQPVVLFHGLGSGGIQFATGKVNPNMAQYLANKGFDVWVAELRTSIALPYSLDQWTLDEVARGDIPRIVDFVLEKTGAEQTNVVAHCIGSAMFCTAALDGKLQHTSGISKIRSAVLLQVGPLITLSKGTRLRGLVIAPLRRFLPDGHVDFSVDDRAGWVEGMIDRLLATYPYPPEEAKHHRLGWSWKRNSHIANCNRWAAIDGRMFQHDNLSPEVLDGLGEILGHSSITTWEQTIQYAFLERLTDSNAKNSYVTAENVNRYMTFPVAFLHGSRNDVFDPLTSWRSMELLRRINGPKSAKLRLLDGYGHIDPLIGKNAAKDVFCPVSCFLRTGNLVESDGAEPTTRTTAGHYLRGPLVGPVLGWVRREGATWKARIWCRLDDLRSPVSFALVVASAEGKAPTLTTIEGGTDHLTGALSVGPIDTTLWADVELGDQPCEYKVAVLSAHETKGEGVSNPHLIAERKAQGALSAREPQLHPDGARIDQVEAFLAQRQTDRNDRKSSDAAYGNKTYSVTVTLPRHAEEESLTFAFGSCRYPGQMLDRERADAAFGVIRDLLEQDKKGPSALLLVGDQIYADATAGAFDPKDRRERYYEAYREAWTAPNARAVLSRVPVYMMLDDHEIGDNWHPEDQLEPQDEAMRWDGLEAFQRYQWIHSPGPVFSSCSSFYYSFALHGFPFFVCDTRTGRVSRERIIDEDQFKALKRWLSEEKREHPARPKLVVSPSVVVPFLCETGNPPTLNPSKTDVGIAATNGPAAYAYRSDGWDGFPDQLRDLFSFIAENEIENIVFLCGDAHLSMCSEIWFERGRSGHGRRRVRPSAYCIVASPMYAPYPFANAKPVQYVCNNNERPLQLSEDLVMRYEVSVPSWAEKDSITLVTIRKDSGNWTIDADVRGIGKCLSSTSFPRRVKARGGRRTRLPVPGLI